MLLLSSAALNAAERLPRQRAGKYEVSLRLPSGGLRAGAETLIEFRIVEVAPAGSVPDSTPVARARINATIDMPSMPGMSKYEEVARPESAPGQYAVHPTFAHSGEYALRLAISPATDQAFTVSFPLQVLTAGSGHSAMDSMETSMGTPWGWYATGTSQVPKATPMDMLHWSAGSWNLMLHGTLFAVETQQSGPRGREKFFSTNWLMPMASRRLGPGTLTIRTMLSLEPATITNQRYPLLFQTDGTLALQSNGTTVDVPVINGQHPHNFFMELAAAYQIPLGERATLHFYGGPRGEPALGPTAYLHRPSASEVPQAPLGHQYQDSTHVATNVVTAGLSYGPVTLEASGFHGQEPEEHRWGLERGAIDSFATRLTVSPTPRWSGQFSAGRIKGPEETHPFLPLFRMTSSVTYVRPLARGHWATSLIWARNKELEYTQPPTPGFVPPASALLSQSSTTLSLPETAGFAFGGLPQASSASSPSPVYHLVSVPTRIPRQVYNSFLAESTILFKSRNWIWGRVENLDKDSTLLYEESPLLLLVSEVRFTRVHAYTAGYERELPPFANWLGAGLGAQLTCYATPDNLKAIYGDHPIGVQVFLRFRLLAAAR